MRGAIIRAVALTVLVHASASFAQQPPAAAPVLVAPQVVEAPRAPLPAPAAPPPDQAASATPSAPPRVLLEVTIGADGTVTAARVLESTDPALDSAALETIRKWKFQAATRDGVAIAAHEFAHYLDHVTHSPDTVYLPHGVSYRECELVAETATWMFLKDINHLDMETQKGAFEYIRSYTQGDLNDIKAAIPRAFACHRLMLDAWDAITTITEHVP